MEIFIYIISPRSLAHSLYRALQCSTGNLHSRQNSAAPAITQIRVIGNSRLCRSTIQTNTTAIQIKNIIGTIRYTVSP